MFLDILVSTPSLPYFNRPLVKAKAAELVRYISSLAPRIGTLIQNDGREFTLITFTGTIPIQYKGHTYHIPIEIYLCEGYPAPSSCVRSTNLHHDREAGALVCRSRSRRDAAVFIGMDSQCAISVLSRRAG
jgi:UEV domain